MFVFGTLTGLLAITSLLAIVGSAPMLNGSEPVAIENATLNYPRIIPVREVGCWYEYLRSDEANKAKRKLERWGLTNLIGSASFNGQMSGHAAVWICNCKQFVKDHVVAAELNEAQDLIALKCGKNRTGWVWSSKWQKSYNFGPTATFLERKHSGMGAHQPTHPVKCPHFCVRNINKKPDPDVGGIQDDEPYKDPDSNGDNDPDNDPDDGADDGQGDDQGDDQEDDQGDDQDDQGDDQDDGQDREQDD
ncbi:hypothetical protein F5B21DRAFT_484695 [Xylaria acuta]|nr:hypothetical protein F5B21DRAFT_484695 [Xylaria acuta]